MSGWDYTASNKEGGDFELAPAGTHVAICIGLVGLGTHENNFSGETELNNQVAIAWELPYEQDKNGNPPVFATRFNIPPNWGPKSNLRKMLESWRGKKYEEGEPVRLGAIIGTPCTLTISHKTTGKGNTVAEYSSIGALTKGTTAPASSRTPFAWAFTPGEVPPVPDWFPWIFGQSVRDSILAAQENQAGAVRKSEMRSAAPLQPNGQPYASHSPIDPAHLPAHPETPRQTKTAPNVDETAFAAAEPLGGGLPPF